jgi:tetratricopeptide (TPR) repeat protein
LGVAIILGVILAVAFGAPAIVTAIAAFTRGGIVSFQRAMACTSGAVLVSGLALIATTYFVQLDPVFRFAFALPPIVLGIFNYGNMSGIHESYTTKNVIISLVICSGFIGYALHVRASIQQIDFIKQKAVKIMADGANSPASQLEAAKTLEGAIKRFPDNMELRYLAALLYLQQNKCDEAKAHLRLLIQSPPKAPTKAFADAAFKCLSTDKKKTEPDPNALTESLKGI